MGLIIRLTIKKFISQPAETLRHLYQIVLSFPWSKIITMITAIKLKIRVIIKKTKMMVSIT